MRKKRKGRKWQVLLALVAAIVILVFFANERARQRLEAARASLDLEKAEEFRRVIEAATAPEGNAPPEAASVPAEVVEAARTRMEAFAGASEYMAEHVSENPLWHKIAEDAFDGWDSWSPEQWGEAEAFLEKHANLIKELQRIAAMEGPLHPIDLSSFPQVDMEHFDEMREAARLLGVDAELRARNGDMNAAVKDIVAQLGIADSAAQEPLVVSQMVAVAIQGMAFASAEAVFAPGTLTDAQRSSLVDAFAGAMNRENMAAALSWETDQFGELFADQVGWIRYTGLGSLWINMNVSHHVETLAPLGEGARTPYYQAVDALNTAEERLAELPFYAMMTRVMAPALIRTLEAPARFEAQAGLLQVGLTVEGYYAEHGAYPPSLDALAPMLGEVPVDPFTGEDFRYVAGEEGFRLYSLGSDLEDDGGVENGLEGDVVWRAE